MYLKKFQKIAITLHNTARSLVSSSIKVSVGAATVVLVTAVTIDLINKKCNK